MKNSHGLYTGKSELFDDQQKEDDKWHFILEAHGTEKIRETKENLYILSEHCIITFQIANPKC